MMGSIPPRLRAPVIMLAGGAVIAAVAVAAWGWGSLLSIGPVTLAASVAFLAAIAARATLWPFYIFITVPAVTFLAGWLVYREHPGGREQQAGR